MSDEKKLLNVLGKTACTPPPVWMMRQAGRYLPEYRAVREEAGSFWTMCRTPELAAEVTLQPVRRFGFDAAILFSDILTVPAALGVDVTFEEKVGPRLQPVSSAAGLSKDRTLWRQALRPAWDALGLVRAKLDGGTALLGFAGAPWTLATYMAAGGGGDEQRAAKLWAYRDPDGFGKLIALLVECVSFHLVEQLKAGADAVQIFDSWAGGLPDALFERWVVQPTKKLVALVRAEFPDAKIIGFPRAATLAGYERYAAETSVTAVSLDTSTPVRWAVERLGKSVALQGNLDPVALLAGGDALARAVDDILDAARGAPLIFNLGHGILPETPVAHVEAMLKRVRA